MKTKLTWAKRDGDSRDRRKLARNLQELQVGDDAHIVAFTVQDDTAKKVEAMGLRVGKKITVLRKLGRGILIRTSHSRIVITSDVAKNIEVK
ncbi:MAG TPA: ferrous iron transport protein A [Candidatus Kryptonia bacterium]